MGEKWDVPMWVSINGCIPLSLDGLYNGKSPSKMDDLGAPPFWETFIWGFSCQDNVIVMQSWDNTGINDDIDIYHKYPQMGINHQEWNDNGYKPNQT